MNDQNVFNRHIKPAARKLGLPFVNWRCLRHFTCDLVGSGGCGSQMRPRSDAPLAHFDHFGHLRADCSGWRNAER